MLWQSGAALIEAWDLESAKQKVAAKWLIVAVLIIAFNASFQSPLWAAVTPLGPKLFQGSSDIPHTRSLIAVSQSRER
jgi:hypothetical protein